LSTINLIMCTFKERGAIARTMGADSTAAGLTEEQAAVYDRQLRVWGVEAQRRLGASRILVAGLTGLAAEACKNVALAGVGAVVLYDDGAPAKDAAPGNFLAAAGLADAAGTPDAEGLTVAAATAATLREMNPFGEISILVGPSDLSGIDVAAVTGCDAVLVAGCPLAVAERINDTCREAGASFFHGECRATSANFFADLGPDFRYTVEKRSTEKEADAGAVDTAMSASFVTLREATRCGWKSLGDGREGGVRRVNKLCPAWLLAARFERTNGRRPTRADVQGMLAECGDLEKEHGVKPGWLKDSGSVEDYVNGIGSDGETVESESPAVAAVVGGILGQELLRSVTGKGEPVRNSFFFSVRNSQGTVENAGCPV
jgi:ubiquitin-like 1-activating enzyme E1 A